MHPGKWMDRLLFEDDLAIYITAINQRAANRALQGVINKLDVWAVERILNFSTSKIGNKIYRKRK